MPSWKRIVAWTCMAALLVALGVGVYHVTPPEPMCEIDVANLAGFVGGGGKQLLAFRPDYLQKVTGTVELEGGGVLEVKSEVRLTDSLKLWDCRTGELLASFLDERGRYCEGVLSPDGRFFAAEVVTEAWDRKGNLVLVDLIAGKVIEVPNSEGHPVCQRAFSPDGTLLAQTQIVSNRPGDTLATTLLQVIETATGRVLYRRRGYGWFQGWAGNDWLVHVSSFETVEFEAAQPHGSDRGGTERTRVPVMTFESFDARTNKSLGKLENVRGSPQRSVDGRHLFAWCQPAKAEKGNAIMWNVATGQIDADFGEEKVAADVIANATHLVRYVTGNPDRVGWLETRDRATGRRLARMSLPSGVTPRLAPDGASLILFGPILQVLRLPTLEMVWEKRDQSSSRVEFSGDGKTLFVEQPNRPAALCAHELHSGRLRMSTALPPGPGAALWSTTPNRRLLMLSYQDPLNPDQGAFRIRLQRWFPWLGLPDEKHDDVMVLDTDSCRMRFRLTGWGTDRGCWLSDDGKTLWTSHGRGDRSLLRFWDVNARKPLHAAVGLPAGLGVVIVLFAWWRERRGRRKSCMQSGLPETAANDQVGT